MTTRWFICPCWSGLMFLYQAKGAFNKRNKSNAKYSSVWLRRRKCYSSVGMMKKDCERGSWEPASHHHSKHAAHLCCYISSSSVQPLQPPTGHPEPCWNTMPVLAQAPTSGPNVEVTSSGKNGIVSLEKHNTLETLVSCVLRWIQAPKELFFQ